MLIAALVALLLGMRASEIASTPRRVDVTAPQASLVAQVMAIVDGFKAAKQH